MTPTTAQEWSERGEEALRQADWHRARDCFAAALQLEKTPSAHDGLGQALWWLNDIEESHKQRAAAYLGYKEQGESAKAALVAVWLGREQLFLAGNDSAMKGWFARADRLLKQTDDTVEHSWCALLKASILASPEALAQIAKQTVATAQTFADPALEALALAFYGLAEVSRGRVESGLQLLDEAMVAAISGELNNFMAVSELFCVTLSAGELSSDLIRAEQWCQMANDYAQRYQCSFLSAYCRTTYGGLLTMSGRWDKAETELVGAIQAFEAGHRALRVHAVLKLADLRVCQGRLEEAELLLRGYEDISAAALPLARLHFAHGEAKLAQAIIQQTLPPPDSQTLHHLPLLFLQVDILLAQEQVDEARELAGQLALLARQTQSDLLIAQAEFALGRAERHHPQQAVAHFQTTLAQLPRLEQSLLASRARLEMAQLLQESDWAGAVTWARAALASFTRLGATYEANVAAALLRQLGVQPRTGPRLPETISQREMTVLTLLAHGLSNREIAERLVISEKTVEHHVSQVLSKLGVRNRAEAAALAVNTGILEQNKGSQ